jgi:hypothetical protein
VHSAYFQYDVLGGPDFDPTVDTTNGVLGVLGEEGLRVSCGCHSGPVRLTLRALDQEPSFDDGWEVAAEADISTSTGTIQAGDWGGVARPDLGNLAGSGRGHPCTPLFPGRCDPAP